MIQGSLFVAALLVAVLVCEGTICPPSAVYWPVEDCSAYVKCAPHSRGQDTPEHCWWLRRFNRATLRCDWFWRVDCTLDPDMPTPAPTTPKYISTIPWSTDY